MLFTLEKKEFIYLLLIVGIVLGTQLIPLLNAKNTFPYIAGDQYVYLGQINRMENRIISDISTIESNNPAIIVIPFWMIAQVGRVFGKENVFFFWVFFSIGIIATLIHLLSKKLGLNSYISLPVFFLSSSGILFYQYMWTYQNTWHGLVQIENLYHPLANIETILFLISLIWFLSEKEKLWINPVLGLIIFFSRTHLAFVYLPFFFALDLLKYKKINWYWLIVGIIIGIYYWYFSQIPEWIQYTNVYYSNILNTSLLWTLTASGIMLLFFGVSLFKKNSLQYALISAFMIFVIAYLFLPLNDRLNFFKTNLINFGGVIGISLLKNDWIKFIGIFLLLIGTPITVRAMYDNFDKYLPKFEPSEINLIEKMKEEKGILFSPINFGLVSLIKTNLKLITGGYWWGNSVQREIDLNKFYSGLDKDLILRKYNPDFVYEDSNYTNENYFEYKKAGSFRILKRVD